MNGYQILQIMPADGWLAIFKNEKSGELFANRLTCWALVKDRDGDTRVVGMYGVDFLESAEGSSSFDGYTHENGFGVVPTHYLEANSGNQ